MRIAKFRGRFTEAGVTSWRLWVECEEMGPLTVRRGLVCS